MKCIVLLLKYIYVIQISVAGKKKIMKGEIYDWFEICLIHQLFLSFIIIILQVLLNSIIDHWKSKALFHYNYM